MYAVAKQLQMHENEVAKQQQTLETVRFLQHSPDYILLYNHMSLQLWWIRVLNTSHVAALLNMKKSSIMLTL